MSPACSLHQPKAHCELLAGMKPKLQKTRCPFVHAVHFTITVTTKWLGMSYHLSSFRCLSFVGDSRSAQEFPSQSTCNGHRSLPKPVGLAVSQVDLQCTPDHEVYLHEGYAAVRGFGKVSADRLSPVRCAICHFPYLLTSLLAATSYRNRCQRPLRAQLGAPPEHL